MKPLAPKTTLQNRYQITQLIGKGGMGEVYLAIDQRLGHSVALKRTTVGDDVMLTDAFENEARTLAQLRHNVLPKVSDHFLENDEQILVMDYISGEDLSERLKATNKPFPLNWVLFWADQLLEALTYLHTHNPPIIHRDIKPQNLKLTDENHIVLLDFGLSKNTIGQTRVTTSGSVVGYTPHYAPMEQIRGTGTNAKSDIFSLSTTLYHLLSNTVPPDALTRADAMLSGMPDPLRPLTELNPEMTDTISDAILKGMEVSQDKRFENARDMQKTLRRAYNDMQKSMSAETLAFNAGNGGISQSDFKTEVIEDLDSQIAQTPVPIIADASVNQSDFGTIEQFPPDVDYSGENTEVIDSSVIQDAGNPDNLDATVQFTGQIADFPNEDSVGMKTEAIPTENLPVNEVSENFVTKEEIPAEIPFDNDFKTSEDFSTNEDFSSESFKTSDDINPEATVPLISLDNEIVENEQYNERLETADGSNWNKATSEVNDNQATSATAGFGLTDNFSPENTENFINEETNENNYSEANSNPEVLDSGAVSQGESAQMPPPPQKSSVGKYIAILGGLGAVLFLLLGTAVGIGWYYTNGGFGGESGKSANTETTPEVTPSVESNPEVVDTNGTNTEEPTNTETEGANTETTESNPDNTDVATTDVTESSKPTGSNPTTTTKTTNKTQTTTKPPVKNTTKPPVKNTTKPPSGDTKKTQPTTPEKKKKNAGVL